MLWSHAGMQQALTYVHKASCLCAMQTAASQRVRPMRVDDGEDVEDDEEDADMHGEDYEAAWSAGALELDEHGQLKHVHAAGKAGRPKQQADLADDDADGAWSNGEEDGDAGDVTAVGDQADAAGMGSGSQGEIMQPTQLEAPGAAAPQGVSHTCWLHFPCMQGGPLNATLVWSLVSMPHAIV